MAMRQFTQRDQDLSFRRPDAAFNYRATAIVRLDGNVLLHRAL